MVKSNAVAFNCDLRLAGFNKTEDSLRVTGNIWKTKPHRKREFPGDILQYSTLQCDLFFLILSCHMILTNCFHFYLQISS